jgi:phosphatidylserine/phosphatidylglycerophosphate/cardiolipin synthase-like enzyme
VPPRSRNLLVLTIAAVLAGAWPSAAQDRLCDPGNEDCRAILINYIRNETVAIDVAFWFMEDARYTNELIQRSRAGVRVRVLVDPRANSSYPLNAQRLAELQNGGIPMRKRLTSYILHWKMMLFHAQNVVQFSGANYSAGAWRPTTATPYENYVDEAIYFTSDTAIVNSFRTRFDDQWVDTTSWANYANIAGPLSRQYGVFPKDPSLNFAPWENYRSRAVSAYDAERRKIDVIMYRITDRAHTDRMLAAVARGIPVRLITEPEQYRDPNRMWHAWNVDRLYMGGVQIRHRAHQGMNHQKSVLLYDQDPATPGDQTMAIFGSSNWTSPSAAGQVEHNMFTTRPYVTSWLINQFERKWNNYGGILENVDFVPLPPDSPKNPAPAIGAVNVSTTFRLTWAGGPWGHLYDLYFGVSTNPTILVASNLAEPSSKTATSTFSYTVPFRLRPGTRYYWKVVGKTMAMQARSSAVWSFTTAGPAPCAEPIADFDGDCRTDLTVYRPSTSEWFARTSSSGYSYGAYQTYQWGGPNDRPISGDFDGDGRLDLVVYRPSNGTWYIRFSSSNYSYSNWTSYQWGGPGDIPLSADFDGDGRTDLVVFRPSTGEWFVRTSSTRYSYEYVSYQWGIPGDIPIPSDFDGDARPDLAVYRPSTGEWFVRFSSSNFSYWNYAVYQWGGPGDIPLAADFDGDVKTDLVVYRPSNSSWYIRYSSSDYSYSNWATYQWGGPGDIPLSSDFDGDTRTDLAVFRPSTGEWFIRYSSTGYSYSYGTYQWGIAGDLPSGSSIR